MVSLIRDHANPHGHRRDHGVVLAKLVAHIIRDPVREHRTFGHVVRRLVGVAVHRLQLGAIAELGHPDVLERSVRRHPHERLRRHMVLDDRKDEAKDPGKRPP